MISKERELELILEATKEVLSLQEFSVTAHNIFDMCKELTGASAGYVALLSEDGSENEVLFLDAGGRECTVDPYLPMPIRGLRAESYHKLTSVYDNEFWDSEWMKFMPEGHVGLENVMFAPLVIEGVARGLIGLANKKSGFNDDDVRIVSAFGDLCAISLQNSWYIDKQGQASREISTLNESLSIINKILRHDLMNDIAILVGYLTLFEKGQTLEINKMFGTLKKMQNLIQRMQELEKVAATGHPTEEFALKPILSELINNYSNQPIEFTITGEGFVLADLAISSLFDNIIRNAVLHSGTEKIDLEIHPNDQFYRIRITDYGKGMPESVQNSLNQGKFFDDSNSPNLGLFIVSRLVKKYNGHLSVTSEDQKGTSFLIQLVNSRYQEPSEH